MKWAVVNLIFIISRMTALPGKDMMPLPDGSSAFLRLHHILFGALLVTDLAQG
jgi:hypothetical protein